MNTNSTYKRTTLLNILIISLIFHSIPSIAQTKYIVEASNTKFTPKDITIEVGDTVEWHNVEGSHNVDGKQSTYPLNPESFGNSVGVGWTYVHVFNIAGKYDYRCDPHYIYGMVGTITVSEVTANRSNLTVSISKIFPNPANEKIYIEPEGFSSSEIQVKIYDITGKLKFSEIYSSSRRIEVNIEQLESGIYFVELNDNNKRQMMKLIKD